MVMNEVRELGATIPDLSAPFVHVGSEATRRLCEHGQSVARTIGDWNTEVGHFVSHRVARNSETFGQMAKCKHFTEVLALQAQWLQDTADDYVKETNKLIEVSSRMMGGLLGAFGQTGADKSSDRIAASPTSY
jgi:hypothetical protein